MTRYCPECGKRRKRRRCDHLANDGNPIMLRSQYPAVEDWWCGAYFSPSTHPRTTVDSRCHLPRGHAGPHEQVMAQR